jgi:predicted MFS family arabinose efflux permease
MATESSARREARPFSPLRATASLIGLRIAYAYNWFDIGPGLPAIGATFALTTAQWGWLVAAFLVGAGAFQVPAGLLARRWGTRAVSLLGAGVLGAASLASAFAPTFGALLVLRAVGGVGAGLFFSPAIVLVASLYPEGTRGVPVGTFSSAFSAGAGLGVFVSAVALPEIGWRGALAIGGVLLLGVLLWASSSLPASVGRPAPPNPNRRPASRVPLALRSPAIWAIGFAFTGLEGASLSAGQYFVPFAQIVRGWSPVLAGAIGALFVFPSVFGGPVGGRLAEARANRRTQLVVFTGPPVLLLALLPFAGVAATAAIALLFSFSYGMVYAVMYVLPPYLPGFALAEVPLAIGLFNGIQLAGGAAVAAAAAWVVQHAGYTVAWMVLAILGAATLVGLIAVPVTPARIAPLDASGTLAPG